MSRDEVSTACVSGRKKDYRWETSLIHPHTKMVLTSLLCRVLHDKRCSRKPYWLFRRTIHETLFSSGEVRSPRFHSSNHRWRNHNRHSSIQLWHCARTGGRYASVANADRHLDADRYRLRAEHLYRAACGW